MLYPVLPRPTWHNPLFRGNGGRLADFTHSELPHGRFNKMTISINPHLFDVPTRHPNTKILIKQRICSYCMNTRYTKQIPPLRMDAEITDAQIAALVDMNEAQQREARRNDVESVLEEAKKKGVYKKRGSDGWRGPSERIANQRRKKEDLTGPGKKADTKLDVLD
nr:zinc finger BED domain-containing protein RICESLEEPER 2 [Tanacetum cinerariifolium]